MKLIKNEKASSKWLDGLIGKLRKHPTVSKLILQGFFLALSVLLFYVVIGMGKANWSVDGVFHWERANEIAHDLKTGAWPQFNQYTGYSGIADETFYPWLTWLPFAVLINLHVPPVVILDILPVAIMFMGLNIAFYSFRTYDKSRLKALTFATMYSASSIMVNLQFMQSENAEYMALMFAPLVLFGWLDIMRGSKKWFMFVAGLVLMTFTHLFAPLLMLIMLGFLTLMSFHKLDKGKIRVFARSAVVFLMSTACVWLPIIILMKHNVIWRPGLPAPMRQNANLLPISVADTFRSFETLWNVPEIVAFVMGLFRWKKLSYYGKRFFVMAVILLVFNCQFMPWGLIQKTFLVQLQFPFRLSFLIRILLDYVFVELIFLNWKHADRDIRVFVVGLLLLLSVIISFKSENVTKSKSLHNDMPKFSRTNVYGVTKKEHEAMSEGKQATIHKAGINLDTYTLTNGDLKSNALHKMVTNPDYAQKAYINSSNKSKQNIVHRNISHVTNRGDKITYTAGASYRNVEVPVMLYNDQDYRFFIDGKPVGYTRTKLNKPRLKKIPKGRHSITFQTPVMYYRSFAVAISAIGLLMLNWPRYFKDDNVKRSAPRKIKAKK